MKFIVLSEVMRNDDVRQKSFNASHILSVEPLNMADDRFYEPPKNAQTIVTLNICIDGQYDYIFVSDHWENIVNRLVD